MSYEVLTLRQAAEHVHLDMAELRHVAQRGEIEAQRRGDEWYFEHRILDEWAQRNLLAANARNLDEQYRAMMAEERRANRESQGIAPLFQPDLITLDMQAKTKAGVLRDLTDLAERGGLVNDPAQLHRELVSREEAAPTAIGCGAALPHPRFHDPFLFSDSFVAYARAARPVYFNAPDGEGTRHFFLVCSTDHAAHLHILARLATLIHGSDLLERLDAAVEPQDVLTALAACEEAYR